MNEKIFVDSNVWLYAFMSSEPNKSEQSTEIITNSSIIISTQVINEICVNLLRKAEYTESEIQQTIKNIYSNYQVINIDE